MGRVNCCFDDTIGVNEWVTVPDKLSFVFVNDSPECINFGAAFTMSLEDGVWSSHDPDDGSNEFFGAFAANVSCVADTGSGTAVMKCVWKVKGPNDAECGSEWTEAVDCANIDMAISDAMEGKCCGTSFTQTVSLFVSPGGVPNATPTPIAKPCENATPEECCDPEAYGAGPGGGPSGGPGGPGGPFGLGRSGGPLPRFSKDGPKGGGAGRKGFGGEGGIYGPPPTECCPEDEACSGGTCGVPSLSPYPVRYASGELAVIATDLQLEGYGMPWGHTRSFGSRMSVNENNGNGFNWQVMEWPYLVVDYDGNVAVLGQANAALWFDRDGDDFVSRFNTKETLVLDQAANVYRLTASNGTVTEFDQLTGLMEQQMSAGGQVILVTDLTDDGYNIAEVQRSYTAGSETITEKFNYTYVNTTGSSNITRVAATRKIGTGSWENIVRCNYTYYGFDAANGGYGDLETATTQGWDGSQWNDKGTSYYRYYKQLGGSSSSSSSSSGGIEPSPVHLLRYVLGPDEYRRLSDDPAVTDPLTASDVIVAQYAKMYFEFDSSRRVTKEVVFGGASTYEYAYAESTLTTATITGSGKPPKRGRMVLSSLCTPTMPVAPC